jgi:hypothetical protein
MKPIKIGLALSLMTVYPAAAVELVDLIKVFMPQALAQYNLLPWEAGTEVEAINWQHDGTRNCPQHLAKKYSFCRTASTIVHINGNATPMVLKRRIEPAPWQITIMGARAGVSAISLDSNVLSHELGEGLLKDATQKDSAFKITQLNRCGSASGGKSLYRIATFGRKDAFAKETWSCGSAGCSADLKIFLFKEDAELRPSEC